MSDRVLSDAHKIKKLMREAEAVTDEATLLYSRLKQAMIASRQNPDVPVATGQIALRRLNEAESQIMSASSNLFRVHNELSDLARVFAAEDGGLPTEPLAVGDSKSAVAEKFDHTTGVG